MNEHDYPNSVIGELDKQNQQAIQPGIPS